MSAPPATYDLVLENGLHRLAVPCAGSPLNQAVDGQQVIHALKLRLPHRLPYVGPILRNFWAKQHGARLYP